MNKKDIIAVYPGSFDPITNGHLDIIIRASHLFSKVIVLVAFNENKEARFSPIERKRFIDDAIKENNLNNVESDYYDGLTTMYCKKHNAKYIIRGLRVVSDFDYEWSYATTNKFIDNDIELVFLMAQKENTFISSSIILELAKNRVDISTLVPSLVNKTLKERYKEKVTK